jgi:hypothetical protein
MKVFKLFRHKKHGEEDPFAFDEVVEYPHHLKQYQAQIDA